jgi:2-oxoglutarate ferredoxin oxidoreductase subunit beta
MSEALKIKLSKKDLESDQDVRWCPGCGDYAILATVQRTLAQIGIKRETTVFISGIGCSSRFPYYMNTYGFHTIHGRAPAIASGLKVTRPELDVWVITGDGDGLSIGGNHMIHALRRNMDLKIILFNNQIYGLTKGQYSPTSAMGTRAPSTPTGSIDHPLNPISLALGSGATFIARAADTDAKLMGSILQEAYKHKGAVFIEMLQNCPVFNDGVWEGVKEDPAGKQIALVEGKPLVFAGGTKGIKLGEGLRRRSSTSARVPARRRSPRSSCTASAARCCTRTSWRSSRCRTSRSRWASCIATTSRRTASSRRSRSTTPWQNKAKVISTS